MRLSLQTFATSLYNISDPKLNDSEYLNAAFSKNDNWISLSFILISIIFFFPKKVFIELIPLIKFFKIILSTSKLHELHNAFILLFSSLSIKKKDKECP